MSQTMGLDLFWPVETKTLSATDTTGSTTFTGASAEQVRVYNKGSNDAYVKWGAGAQAATTNDMPIPAGNVETFYKGSSDTIAAVCDSGLTTIIAFTSGRGV